MVRPALKRVPVLPPRPTISSSSPQSSRALIILAFAAVYLIWGSTYLAIRFAIETVPPFLMAATRFLIAGSVLLIWSNFQHNVRPSFSQWRRAFIVGALLLLCGNGGVTWSEKYIASGLTALLVATEPLWVVLFNWVITRKRPNAKVLSGVVIGLAGVALLVSGAFKGVSTSSMSYVGAVVVVASALAWAGGSVFSSRRPLNVPTAQGSAMQMLAGGSLLFLAAIVSGDFGSVRLSNTSWTSIGALLYLIVFGSIVAFTAYSWLLRKVAPAKAATYAYVNPVVAVFLGWLFASEPITARTIVAAVIIVGSVVMITTFGPEAKQSDDSTEDDVGCPTHPCA